MKYFGSVQVVGRCMYANEDSAVVRGVYEDFPENSIVENCVYGNFGKENEGNFQNYNYNCYLRLREQMDIDKVKQLIIAPLVEKIHQLYKEH